VRNRYARGIRGSVVGFGIAPGSQPASTSLTAHFGGVADASRDARGSAWCGSLVPGGEGPPAARRLPGIQFVADADDAGVADERADGEAGGSFPRDRS
jgi:hypothetical protein